MYFENRRSVSGNRTGRNQAVLEPAPSVAAVDSTGAGDAFVGSLAFFVAAGKPLREAIRRANHIAALSVRSSGTQSSFPSAEDLDPSLPA